MKLMNRTEAMDFLGVTESEPFNGLLDLVIEANLLTSIDQGEETFIDEDIESIRSAFNCWLRNPPDRFYNADLFSQGQLAAVTLPDGTVLRLKSPGSDVPSAYYAAVPNVVRSVDSSEVLELDHCETSYFGDAALEVSSKETRRILAAQVKRSNCVDVRRASQFANSAYYMGSKKNLGGFLVEAISSEISPDARVLDLMCGSGAAACAFSSVWETSASDAMDFCRVLTSVQGGGFSAVEGSELAAELLPVARQHADELVHLLASLLDQEDSLFHRELDIDLQKNYQHFLEHTLVYPNVGSIKGWNPLEQVIERKQMPDCKPYCLFTAYFANVYFGVRQCVEIDSLRFAIQEVACSKRRDFAMGALIASCSALSTTYAGHFAQPVIRDPKSLSLARVRAIIEQRARSVFHEFDVRLRELSTESEKSQKPISKLAGPWREALSEWKNTVSGESLVYVDAPYKREEYSRYYHVLETLVKYNYPASTGKGHLPDRSSGEIFQSEFFTRNKSRLENELSELILAVLDCNSVCAWSYSNTGEANINNVLRAVSAKRSVTVRAYNAPFTYSGQGGKPAQNVLEYLFLIR